MSLSSCLGDLAKMVSDMECLLGNPKFSSGLDAKLNEKVWKLISNVSAIGVLLLGVLLLGRMLTDMISCPKNFIFGEAGIGGCLRNEQSKCLISFSKSIGMSDVTSAEIAAISEAVKLFRNSAWIVWQRKEFDDKKIYAWSSIWFSRRFIKAPLHLEFLSKKLES
ncbi:hypothetical protein GQ457_17G000750 [Hibiscus cannabinus]